jgi:hypothetical protein
MTKIDNYTTWYEQSERINLPPSFKLMKAEGDTYWYGAGAHGREVTWTFNQDLSRWGWVVKKVSYEECCA